MYCKRCGQPVEQGANYCTNCGARVAGEAAPSSQPVADGAGERANEQDAKAFGKGTNGWQEGYRQLPGYYGFGSDEWGTGSGASSEQQELALFVGPQNTTKYLRTWRREVKPGSSVGWHWPAFFFAPMWFAYRKMFAYMWAVIGIQVAITLLNLTITNAYKGFLGLGFDVVCSLFAYPLYYRHAMAKIGEAKRMAPGNERAYIVHKGGTSGAALALVIIGEVLFGIVIASLSVLALLHTTSSLATGYPNFGSQV